VNISTRVYVCIDRLQSYSIFAN